MKQIGRGCEGASLNSLRIPFQSKSLTTRFSRRIWRDNYAPWLEEQLRRDDVPHTKESC
ncbi:hypothetical protein ACHAWO_006419 [Cyclotella atomus]|uniref:Uncharacterized protein n=1 Tax=Cyclotella atomus TaxID=382360 RepID=A0ABD3PIK0_9STRA